MKKLLFYAAFLTLIASSSTASNIDEQMDNLAGMLASDQLCGTGYSQDGRYEQYLKTTAFFNNYDEDIVRQMSIRISIKYAKVMQQNGRVNNFCDKMWKLY